MYFEDFDNDRQFERAEEIARSSYGDMLHDDERNRAYSAAINAAVDVLVKDHKEGRIECLDIGTGSGILSMMIARAFRVREFFNFHVTTCEQFQPMAVIARSVIDFNEYDDCITVEECPLNQLEVKPRFSLVVAELLDTQLINEETCLITYMEAKKLCLPNCIFIPHRARIYIEPIASKFLFNRKILNDATIDLGNGKLVEIKPTDAMKECPGLNECDEIQASRLELGVDFERFTKPQVVFNFIFGELTPNDLRIAVFKTSFKVSKKITQPVVIAFWWQIEMYDRTRIDPDVIYNDDLDKELDVLSTAPTWARDDVLLQRDAKILRVYGREMWREHWLQGIYTLVEVPLTRRLVDFKVGDMLDVYAGRDDRSFWFSLKPQCPRPRNCNCGAHRQLGISHISHMNDLESFTKVLRSILQTADNQRYIGFFDEHWDIKFWIVRIGGLQDSGYRYSITPFHKFDRMLVSSASKTRVKFTQVIFKSLNRIKQKIGCREGFNFGKLDAIVGVAVSSMDYEVEDRYLWEYECVRIDNNNYEAPVNRFRLPNPTSSRVSREMLAEGWGLVFWQEVFYENTGEMISTGPIGDNRIGDIIRWPKWAQQSNNFMHDLAANPKFDLNSMKIEVELSDKIQVRVNY